MRSMWWSALPLKSRWWISIRRRRIFEKDSSWPDCSTFQKGDVLDFHLSRGEKTKFLSDEKTAWWRKEM